MVRAMAASLWQSLIVRQPKRCARVRATGFSKALRLRQFRARSNPHGVAAPPKNAHRITMTVTVTEDALAVTFSEDLPR